MPATDLDSGNAADASPALLEADYAAANVQPWPHQLEAISAIRRVQTKRCLVQHAAGSGKSLTIAGLAAALADDGFARVVVICDRRQLDAQIYATVRRICERRHTVDRAASVADLVTASATILCTTLQKVARAASRTTAEVTPARAKLERRKLPTPGRTAVLVDECHRSYADDAVWRRLDDALGTPSLVVGFTATPEDRELVTYGNPAHCFPLAAGIRHGFVLDVLRDFRAPRLPVTVLDAVSQRPVVDARLRRLALETTAVVQAKAAHACTEIRAVQANWPRARAMVICRSRRAVATWTRALRRLGLETYGAFSDVLSDGLDETKLNPGSLSDADVVVVCGKLEAGYDDPRLACLIVDRPISAPARLVQVYSRINRAAPGKPLPRVVDFANGAEFVAFAFRRFWEERKMHHLDRSRLGAAAFRALSFIDAAGAADLDAAHAVLRVATVLGADAAAALGADAAAVVEASKDEECPEFPAAYAKQVAAALQDDGPGENADAEATFATSNVSVAVGAVIGGAVAKLAVDAISALPTHGGAGLALRPGESLAELTRRAARGHLVVVLAGVAKALAEAPDAVARLAALRRLDRLAVDDAEAIARSGVGRAAAALKRSPDAAVASLARRVVSAAKKRVAAAAPPDTTPKLEALGLPRAVAVAVASAVRSRPAAEVRALLADLRRNDALRGRIATGALSPAELVAMSADERATADRKRKAAPLHVEEEVLAEGYVCETCGSSRITCATESRPTTSYGTSEFRQILFLDCLACGRSWRED